MKGYIKNLSSKPLYALKRHILAGATVDLETLYKEYGDKHGIEKGKPFVDWLRKVKLPDEKIWQVHLEESSQEENKITLTAKITQTAEVGEKKEGLTNVEKVQSARPHVKKEWDFKELANLTVKQAREEIPKIRDRKVLSYALNVARQMPNKETVCRILEKRIDEIKISSR